MLDTIIFFIIFLFYLIINFYLIKVNNSLEQELEDKVKQEK
jgi:hypothetical protein